MSGWNSGYDEVVGALMDLMLISCRKASSATGSCSGVGGWVAASSLSSWVWVPFVSVITLVWSQAVVSAALFWQQHCGHVHLDSITHIPQPIMCSWGWGWCWLPALVQVPRGGSQGLCSHLPGTICRSSPVGYCVNKYLYMYIFPCYLKGDALYWTLVGPYGPTAQLV